MRVASTLEDIRKTVQGFSFTLLLVCACGTCPIAAFAQDNWLGGAGNWSDPSKWSAGVPGATSNVFIDNGNAKASPVTMDIQGQANNLTIDSDDSLSFNNGTLLSINGSTISNAGAISLNSVGSGTFLLIANGATLSGAGTVTMSNNSQNAIDGNSGAILTNKSTIQGGGQIGPHITLNNQGTMNANVSGAALAVLQATGANQTNTATMQATNGGILQIATGSGGALNNTGGIIAAVGTNSQVQFTGFGTIINGGTLTSSSGGTIVQPSGSASTLNGVTNAGTFSMLNGSNVNLGGTITNTGSIQLNSTGSFTLLNVPTAATLTGTGKVIVSNNSQNFIDGNGGAMLINQSTIEGAGQIGDHLTLANQGTINANVSGAILAVTQDTNATDTNSATLEATNGGILQIRTSGSGSINNTGGIIEAVGTNSQVQFAGFGTIINGGTLSSSSGGQIVVPAGLSANLNGVTNAGTFSILSGGIINLLGNLTNNGTITLNSAGPLTLLNLPTVSVTLLGKGRVVLNNNPNSTIDGNGGLIFTNQSTIQGGGTIGPHFTFSNKGTLHVTARNILNINAPFTNFSGSTLTGGTYTVAGTLQFTNANISTNSAKITLSGKAAQMVNQSNVNALASFATNASTGSFSVTAGQQFTTTLSGGFSNAGKVMVGKNSGFKVACNPNFQCPYTQTAGTTTVDGTLTDNLWGVQIQGGKLFGTGTIAAAVTSSGAVTAGDSTTKPGILSTSAYTQNSGGSLNIQIGGTNLGTQYSQLAVGNGASLNGTLNVKLINSFVPAVGNTFTILTGSAVTGTFAKVNLPTLSGAHFTVTYNPTNVTLTVVSGT